ncbi:MAG: ABC transporter permease subunit [Anaerolineaceae bacterium]|jgi:ABC-type spermidine/putrescine transport system permease subunit II|nr:ABC transporter permease subunit [Anaerolineae bacterium]NLF11130.1 ABC transporter permease subunit [Anaerolineaceae bacterium]
MDRNKILKKSAEAVALVLLCLVIFGPMLGLAIWSVALRWYWPHLLPQEIGFDYWLQALGLQKSLAVGAISITGSLRTSLILAVVVVAIVMLLSTPVGFVLARYRIPFKGAILLLFLMPQAFPQQPVFVNLLLVFTKLDLAGTIEGVLMVHLMVCLVFAVWISTAAFKAVPPELEEAARSVGASGLRTFFRITLPLAMPGLLASSVFVFLTSLDEFTGTFFIGLPFVSTLPMLLYSSSGFNLQFASVIAIVLLIPSILFMVIIERFLKAEYIGGIGV